MPETPELAAALAKQTEMKNANKARVAALRSQNMLGGAHLYNMGMGDKTPISDFIFGEGGAGAETGTLANPNLTAESSSTLPNMVNTDAALGELDMMMAEPSFAGAEAAGVNAAGAPASAATAIPSGSAAALPTAAPVLEGAAAATTPTAAAAGAAGASSLLFPVTAGLAGAYLLSQTDAGEKIGDGLSDALRFIDPFELFS